METLYEKLLDFAVQLFFGAWVVGWVFVVGTFSAAAAFPKSAAKIERINGIVADAIGPLMKYGLWVAGGLMFLRLFLGWFGVLPPVDWSVPIEPGERYDPRDP